MEQEVTFWAWIVWLLKLLVLALIVGIPFLVAVVLVSQGIYNRFLKRIEKRLEEKYQKKSGGFTLIEVLVVLTLMGLVFSLLVFVFSRATDSSLKVSARSEELKRQASLFWEMERKVIGAKRIRIEGNSRSGTDGQFRGRCGGGWQGGGSLRGAPDLLRSGSEAGSSSSRL